MYRLFLVIIRNKSRDFSTMVGSIINISWEVRTRGWNRKGGTPFANNLDSLIL